MATTTTRIIEIGLEKLAGQEGLYYRAGGRYTKGKLTPPSTLPWYLDSAYFSEMVRLSRIKDGHTVLDIVTGNPISGVTAMYLKRAAPGARVIGIEKSLGLLKTAAENATRLGITGIEWEPGDAQDLVYADATFDVVVDRLGLHHDGLPMLSLAEIYRVLKPGGRLVYLDIVLGPDQGAQNWINETYRVKSPNHVKWYTQAETDDMMTKTGFSQEEAVPWDLPMHMDELGFKTNDDRKRFQDALESGPADHKRAFKVTGSGDDQEFTVPMTLTAYVKPAK